MFFAHMRYWKKQNWSTDKNLSKKPSYSVWLRDINLLLNYQHLYFIFYEKNEQKIAPKLFGDIEKQSVSSLVSRGSEKKEREWNQKVFGKLHGVCMI